MKCVRRKRKRTKKSEILCVYVYTTMCAVSKEARLLSNWIYSLEKHKEVQVSVELFQLWVSGSKYFSRPHHMAPRLTWLVFTKLPVIFRPAHKQFKRLCLAGFSGENGFAHELGTQPALRRLSGRQMHWRDTGPLAKPVLSDTDVFRTLDLKSWP